MSVLLHGAAVALVVWIAWRMTAPIVESPREIFDVLPGEVGSPSIHADNGASATPGGSVTFKPLPIPERRIAPVQPEQPEQVEIVAPVVPAPRSQPAVNPVRPTAPTPAPVVPATPLATTREIPRPTSAKLMTLAEYRKAHPSLPAPIARPTATAPVTSATSTAAANAPVGAPPKRIDIARVMEGGGTSVPGASASGGTREGTGSSPAAGAGGERDSFLARLSEKLREAHRKPEGMDDGLRASVAFVLHESGTISEVKIVKSSGDEDFDASAVAAFRRVTALGRPPVTLVGANVIVFRTLAD